MSPADRHQRIRSLVLCIAHLTQQLQDLLDIPQDISSAPLPFDNTVSDQDPSESFVVGARVIITAPHLRHSTGVITAVVSPFSVTIQLDSDPSIFVTKFKTSLRLL